MVVVVVDSKFSVLLWSKALVLDLDQAEQQAEIELGLNQAKTVQDTIFFHLTKLKSLR